MRSAIDISYLVSDFKYSQAHGLKICEVQHGSLSAVEGDFYISGGDGTISPAIADFFASFTIKKWAAGLIYPPLQRSLEAREWGIYPSLTALLCDQTFLEYAALRPLYPFSLSSYRGMVYADYDTVCNVNVYTKAYPGIIFIKAVTFPYWRDKDTMNLLFNVHDELSSYKAEWRLYPKKYDPRLSKRIQEDMPSELYVIKPRGECLANGVIVVARSDLDGVLHMILKPSIQLEKHLDTKYRYWLKNKDDAFLIEKYYGSDYLSLACPLSGKTISQGAYHCAVTIRLACFLCYNEGNIRYHYLGAFLKLPCKVLEEEVTLNEKRISWCKAPFYRAVDPALLKELNPQMERVMLLLYEVMLNQSSPGSS